MRLTLLITIFFFLNDVLYSQCSDAGVCIIGKNINSIKIKKQNYVSFNANYGSSGKQSDINGLLNDISVISITLDANFALFNDFNINASIPYKFINGPLGENNGIGDIQLIFSKKIKIKKLDFSFYLGGIISTGRVNTKDSLPQRYMTGLGTNDIIAGAIYTGKNYLFGAGYQKSFGRSSNYITRLKRGDDVFFRAGFFEQFNKIFIKAEILTIIRINRSNVLISSNPESFTEIYNSNETQVNLLASLNYSVTDNTDISINSALPFLKRDYNFDGLKRKFSLGVGVIYKF
jgi:hypothetical protein